MPHADGGARTRTLWLHLLLLYELFLDLIYVYEVFPFLRTIRSFKCKTSLCSSSANWKTSSNFFDLLPMMSQVGGVLVFKT